MPLPEPRNEADLQPFLDNPERLTSESRELQEGWQEALDAELQNVELGQNDRLAVELLKIGPVPDCFFSEWVPAERNK